MQPKTIPSENFLDANDFIIKVQTTLKKYFMICTHTTVKNETNDFITEHQATLKQI